uniref:Uncharacterized protein n=1 Tax=Arundo donax TaxID=35708 RepID=A0A0A9GJW7_ARUDO
MAIMATLASTPLHYRYLLLFFSCYLPLVLSATCDSRLVMYFWCCGTICGVGDDAYL